MNICVRLKKLNIITILSSMNNGKQICNNCRNYGHMFYQCKFPIVSYGIISFRLRNDGKPEYLMIRRKDSFGYLAFLRGKYAVQNHTYIQNLINEMTNTEKARIVEYSFSKLWGELWGYKNINQYKSEEVNASKKFNLLQQGIGSISIKTFVENSTTNWCETEWEFPKGRINKNEKEIDCALREFEEETGYLRTDINVISNLVPFDELFVGSNHKAYRHKYFLGKLNNVNYIPKYQQSEVSKISWGTLEECLLLIRSYHVEKAKIISDIDFMLKNHSIK